MKIDVSKHHLPTSITFNIITAYVLTEEWQSAKQMYPTYTKQMVIRTHITPVISHNFLVILRKLCDEGKAESMEIQEKTKWGRDNVKPTKLFRKKMQ
jgi:hypothetical protein